MRPFRFASRSAVAVALLVVQSAVAQWEGDDGTSDATAASSQQPHGQWWILLAATQDYPQNIGLSNLKYCHADLQLARDWWVTRGNARPENIVFLHDQPDATPKERPTWGNINQKLNEIAGKAGPEDGIVVMLAGHGVSLDGSSYYCPCDAQRIDVARKSNLLSLRRVMKTLGTCNAQYKLLIVDACRDTPGGAAGPAAKQDKDFVSFFRTTLDSPGGDDEAPWKGMAVLTSCTAGEKAYDLPDWKHGAFTYALIEGICGPADTFSGNNDGVVSLREAACYASFQTKRLVAKKYGRWQTPDLFLGESTLNLQMTRLVSAPQQDEREDDLHFLLRTGNELAQHFDYDTAIDAFSQVVRMQPENVSGFALRAVAYRSRQDYQRALPDFQNAGLDMELMVQNPDGAVLTDRRGGRHQIQVGQRLLITSVDSDRLYVSAVDHGRSREQQGWIDAKSVGWDPGLVDMYCPVTSLNAYSAGERATRALEILNDVPYVGGYTSTATGWINTVERWRDDPVGAALDRLPGFGGIGGFF